jgi:hypothetical protein
MVCGEYEALRVPLMHAAAQVGGEEFAALPSIKQRFDWLLGTADPALLRALATAVTRMFNCRDRAMKELGCVV